MLGSVFQYCPTPKSFGSAWVKRLGRILVTGLLTTTSTAGLWASRAPQAQAATFTYTNTTAGALDNVATSCAGPLVRTFTVTDSFTVEDVNLGFNADHTYRGDLQVTLIHPDGTAVQVISSDGGGSQNGYDVLLDDSAAATLNDGNFDDTSAPFYDRTVLPSNQLATFNGKPAAGTWTLEICDTFAGDSGTFNSAQLILDDTAPPTPPLNPSLPTGERPFSLRYQVETTGNIEAVGNAVVTCNTNLSACNNALNAGTAGNNNGGLAMEMIDIDSDNSTFNSSSAELNIPTGANILFAGLYWGGTSDGATTPAPDSSKRNEALLATPGGGYQTVVADTFTSMDNSGTTGWDVYNSFMDVTSLVQAAGSGTYQMANVQASTGTVFTYPQAGWALVVVYEHPNEPQRNLTVFDGYQFTGFGTSITNTLTGIRTPPTPGFDVFMGAIAGDGEIDTSGDFLAINGTNVTDNLNPANNFFNGTISRFGSHVTARNPNVPYNLAVDIDYLDLTAWNQANNAIPTGATSIDLTLGTQGDGIWPFVYFFGVDVFEPNLVTQFQKSTPDTSYATGDVVPYTLTMTNTGLDRATDVVVSDPLPPGTTFVPGSLKIDGVTQTDGAGDDQAEFDGTTVTFRVGTGATATEGGDLGLNATVSMEFSVTVTAVAGESVTNQATVDYIGDVSKNPGTGMSDDPNTPLFGDPTVVTVTPPPERDYGDAPDTYGTDAIATNSGTDPVGPSHIIVSGLQLGATPDAEAAAVAPFDATGDDADGRDDEGGVTLALLPAQSTSYTIPAANIAVTNTLGRAATLHGWVDFDGSGTFEADEYASQTVAAGVTNGNPEGNLVWSGVSGLTGGTTTYARFRLTTDASIDANTPGGDASDGEVEDYPVAIAITQTIDDTPAATACTVQGGTLTGSNLFTPLDNGTMGFEDGSPDQSPATNPYPGVVNGGEYAQYGSGNGRFRNPVWGQYSYVANIQNARNRFQHNGITDPVYGETGRFFVSDPAEDTPTMTISLTGLTPNQFYEYSFWAANSEPQGTPNNVDILIEGVSVYSTGPLPEVPEALAWRKHTFTFTNGPKTSVVIDLRSTETGRSGRDFYLDNIELRACTFGVDYGDAPPSYGDAVHTTPPVTPTVFLGSAPTADTMTQLGGDNGAGADGDVDEALTTLPTVPMTGTYDLTDIPVTNTSGTEATLHGWVDFNQNGQFEVGEYASTTVVDGATTADLSWGVPADLGGGGTFARFRFTQNELLPDDAATPGVDERSQDAVINGEVEDYPVAIAVASNPNLILVKRVTAIAGAPITGVVDGAGTEDNDAQWPANYLQGAIDTGTAQPGDELEYTIYFLSNGNVALEDVAICDLIPAHTTYIENSGELVFGTHGATPWDDARNTDEGEYFVPNTTVTNVQVPEVGLCRADHDTTLDFPAAENTNGAIWVELDKITTPIPAGQAGYIRFRVTVNETPTP